MKTEYKIHFTINGVEDYFTVQGKNMEEIRAITKQETDRRRLDENKNNLWSEKVI